MPRIDFPPVTLDEWRRRVRDELGGASPETLARHTLAGLELEPLYGQEHRGGVFPVAPGAAGAPRLCPAVASIEPEAIVHEIAEHLGGGAAGVWLDDRRSDALAASPDPHFALDRDGVAGTSMWLDVAETSRRWPDLWLRWLHDARLEPGDVRLRLGFDPLGRLARRGALSRPVSDELAEVVPLMREMSEGLPGATVVGVSTMPYQEAGASADCELGFAVATLLEYARAVMAAGEAAEELLSRTTMRFAVSCQVFPEIAKLRAVRILWRAVCGALGLDRVPQLELHVVGSRRTYSRREPRLNLLRATQQAVIAACGGASAISLWGHDGVDGETSELGRRLARNVPLILEHEGDLGQVADPAAGAYLVEAVTTRLAEDGWRIAREIERGGGMLEELGSGRVRQRVDAAWRARREAYEEGRAGLVGVTAYVDGEASPPALERPGRDAAGVAGDRIIEPFTLRRDAEPYEGRLERGDEE